MRVLVLIGGLLALALPATAAAEAPALRPFPHETGGGNLAGPATDGLRYVVINSARGLVRVYDTETRSTHEVTLRENCGIRGATVNFALVSCTDDHRPFLMRLATRELAPVEVGRDPGGPPVHWGGIGRHWIAGYSEGNRGANHYLNWRTGETAGPHDAFEGPSVDLDSPSLDEYSASHWIFVRNGPFVMKDTRDRRLAINRDGRRVYTRRCRGLCTLGRLSGGLATWAERADDVLAHDLKARRTLRWRVAPRDGFGRFDVLHTRKHVFVVLSRSDFSGSGSRVLWARVRR